MGGGPFNYLLALSLTKKVNWPDLNRGPLNTQFKLHNLDYTAIHKKTVCFLKITSPEKRTVYLFESVQFILYRHGKL